jgi:hypothetical protein
MGGKRNMAAVSSGSRTALRPETLAKNRNIPLENAKQNLTVTTQQGIRNQPTVLTGKFKTNDRMLWYNCLNAKIFTDTLEAGALSRRQNKYYAQAFVIPPYWTKAYAMRSKSDAHHMLSSLFHDVGVPETLVMDGSKE